MVLARDDVGFMRAIRDDILRRRNVDDRRVYSTGTAGTLELCPRPLLSSSSRMAVA